MRRYQSREQFRTAWQMADEVDPMVPLSLDLELSSKCNCTCPMCFRASKNWPKGTFMSEEMARKIIDEADAVGVPSFKPNWRGESTLHPQYTSIMKYAASKEFHEIVVNTNLSGPDESLMGLMQATRVIVSFDSAIATTHAKMRPGAEYERVIDNIAKLITWGHPNLWLRRVRTKLNANEDFLQGCVDLFGDPKGKYHVAEHMCVDRGTGPSMAADELGTKDGREGLPRKYCAQPSQRLVVSAEGHAAVCCLDYRMENTCYSVAQEGLQAIWTCPALDTMRADLRAGRVEKYPVCVKCESWAAYEHPNRVLLGDQEMA